MSGTMRLSEIVAHCSQETVSGLRSSAICCLGGGSFSAPLHLVAWPFLNACSPATTISEVNVPYALYDARYEYLFLTGWSSFKKGPWKGRVSIELFLEPMELPSYGSKEQR